MNESTLSTIDCDFNNSAARACEGGQLNHIYDICTNRCIKWQEFPLPTGRENVVTYGIVFPCLLFLVIVANVFVVLVLSRKHMVSPTNLVILYMAVAELCVGLVPFPFTFFYYTLGYYAKRATEVKVWWCYMYQILYVVMPPTFHNIANWLTVLLASQRFVYIHYPLRAGSLCTVANVRRASIIIVVACIVFGFQTFIDNEFDVFDGYRAKLRRNMSSGSYISGEFIAYRRSICVYRPRSIVRMVGEHFYYNVYYWSRVILFICLPCFLLIILNFLLVVGIRKANHRRARLLMENRKREARRQTESNMTSVMLVVIVTIFLIVNLPQGFFLAIFVVNETFNLRMAWLQPGNPGHTFVKYFMLIDNMMIIASYPINFAIYCSMSSQFRDTFKRFFIPKLPQVPSLRRRFSRNSTHMCDSMRETHVTEFNSSSQNKKLSTQLLPLRLARLKQQRNINGKLRLSGSAANCRDVVSRKSFETDDNLRTESLPLMDDHSPPQKELNSFVNEIKKIEITENAIAKLANHKKHARFHIAEDSMTEKESFSFIEDDDLCPFIDESDIIL